MFPTKDQMGDYLEAYAERFALPVRTGVTVDRVSRWGSGFLVSEGEGLLMTACSFGSTKWAHWNLGAGSPEPSRPLAEAVAVAG